MIKIDMKNGIIDVRGSNASVMADLITLFRALKENEIFDDDDIKHLCDIVTDSDHDYAIRSEALDKLFAEDPEGVIDLAEYLAKMNNDTEMMASINLYKALEKKKKEHGGKIK